MGQFLLSYVIGIEGFMKNLHVFLSHVYWVRFGVFEVEDIVEMGLRLLEVLVALLQFAQRSFLVPVFI